MKFQWALIKKYRIALAAKGLTEERRGGEGSDEASVYRILY